MTQAQTTEIISVAQLPVIIEKLHDIKAEIEASTSEALALECTEDTVKTVKSSRAALTKSFTDYENRRKDVKTQILAPYDAFEKVYKECITEPFKAADTKLAKKIGDVESGLKNAKRDELIDYFDEYRTSIGLSDDDAPFDKAGFNVTLSATLKSLKEQAKAWLDGIQRDLALIGTLDDHDEILVEYKRTGSVTEALSIVNTRHKAIEEARRRTDERKRAEEAQAAAEQKVEAVIEEYAAPVETAPEAPVVQQEPILSVTFTVKGTRAQLRALKEFLNKGGYDFE